MLTTPHMTETEPRTFQMRRSCQSLVKPRSLGTITALMLINACTSYIAPVVTLPPLGRQPLEQSVLVLLSEELENYEIAHADEGARYYFAMGHSVTDALETMFGSVYADVEVRRNVGQAAQMLAIANIDDLSVAYLAIPRLQATVVKGVFDTLIEVEIVVDFIDTASGQSTIVTAESRDSGIIDLSGTTETAIREAVMNLQRSVFGTFGSR